MVGFVHIQKILTVYMIGTYNNVIQSYEKNVWEFHEQSKSKCGFWKVFLTILSDTNLHLQLWIPGP